MAHQQRHPRRALHQLLLLPLLAVAGMAHDDANAPPSTQQSLIRRRVEQSQQQQEQQPLPRRRGLHRDDGRICEGLPRSQSSDVLLTLSRRNRPDREYRISTPPNYDPTRPSKVVLAFHGLGGGPNEFFRDPWLAVANDYQYVVVAPKGLGESWSVTGSNSGFGQDGSTITTCNNDWSLEDSCQDSCAPCPSRCGWTQCEDDDMEFVLALLEDMKNYVCVDPDRVYAFGISNGAMLTWEMGQDSRTAPYLAGLAPVIGIPHHDYRMGKGSPWNLPVLGIYGVDDSVIPPGGYKEAIVEEEVGGYYYVPAHRMHTTWAMDHDCTIDDPDARAPGVYESGRSDVVCRTFCGEEEEEEETPNAIPSSVDCRAEMGHMMRPWQMEMALEFFDKHAAMEQAIWEATAAQTSVPTSSPTATPTVQATAAPIASPATTTSTPTQPPTMDATSSATAPIATTTERTASPVTISIPTESTSSSTSGNDGIVAQAVEEQQAFHQEEDSSSSSLRMGVGAGAGVLLTALMVGCFLRRRRHSSGMVTSSFTADGEISKDSQGTADSESIHSSDDLEGEDISSRSSNDPFQDHGIEVVLKIR